MRRAFGLSVSLGAALFGCSGGGTPPPSTKEASAPEPGLFRNGDVISYAMKNDKGAVIGRSHSTYFEREGSPQVLTRLLVEAGASSSSEFVTTTRPDLSPTAFKYLSSSGARIELRFKDHVVSVISQSGAEEAPSPKSDAVLVPQNDFMMLALVLKRANLRPGTSVAVDLISPETARAEPIQLQVFLDVDKRTVVQTPFGKAYLDRAGRIARFEAGGGLTFEREEPPGPQPRLEVIAEAPKYVHPSNSDFRDREISIDVREGQLAGTLSEPRRTPAPAVVFLSGVPAQDRHGFTGAIDMGTWQILDRLAEEGFAVLRIDDRGMGRTASRLPAGELGPTLSLEDAKAMIAFLRRQPAVDGERVFVIGQGQGALIALMLAASDQLAGLALVAAPYRKWGEAGVDKTLAQVDEDVAVFQGMKDIEVSWREDAKPIVDALKKHGNKRGRLYAYENVDHLMKAESGEPSTKRYADRTRRVDGKFLDDLVAWMKERARKR